MRLSRNKKIYLFIFFIISSSLFATDEVYKSLLKKAALDNDFERSADINLPFDKNLSEIGKRLFEDKALSFNSNTSCSSCHVDRFGSADGLPVAFGVGAEGEGKERIKTNGKIVPRNALPLWGRGGKDFHTFFWDGRVFIDKNGKVRSQIENTVESSDPLIVAAHLPFVAIREMVEDNEDVSKNLKKESIDITADLYQQLVDKLSNETSYIKELAELYGVEENEVTFNHIATSIAHFIRDKFSIKKTPFENFVFEDSPLSDDAIMGGILFYGKAKCSSCHTGKYFSDLKFYSLPFKQSFFGMNGFGVDYGKYNMTENNDDLYKFRTPPLYNVEKTAPYSHSGSYNTLQEVIIAHYDPLRDLNFEDLDYKDRIELIKRIKNSPFKVDEIPTLSDTEINQLSEFLKTLTFD